MLASLPQHAFSNQAVAGSAWDDLLADLRILDKRLHVAVARARASPDGSLDPQLAGLLIGAGDAERWLASLPAAISTDPSGDLGWPGAAGGRLARLATLFGLTSFEQALLLTALAPELDPTYGNLYGYIHDDVTRKYASLSLMFAIWCGGPADRLAARDVLAPDAPLRRHHLLDVDDAAGPTPLAARPVLIEPRIAAYLLGSDRFGPPLAGAARLVQPEAPASPGPPTALPAAMRARLAAAAACAPGGAGLVVWMGGPDALGKRAAAAEIAAHSGRPLLLLDTPTLVAAAPDLPRAIALALRESLLRDALLFWNRADALAPARDGNMPEAPRALATLLRDWPGCALFDLGSMPAPVLDPGPRVAGLDFPAPGPERRRGLWVAALAGQDLAADVDLGLLSGAFRLTGEQIQAAAESARQAAAWHAASAPDADTSIAMRDLVAAARAHSSSGLGMLARKVVPRYTWADLVLPPDRLSQLHEMVNSVRYGPVVFEQWGFDRKLSAGKGVNVLFAGAPGTGKTMAAEVLAADLGLDLYKIDLASIVSKYIGETEKNLERIFREGGSSNAILFFDEADSIFGKRSEVKDSHDRYANIEVSYLLQRMEEYDGIVILATNLRKNLDEAFIRRLRGAIEFPMPEERDRLEIWWRTFPPEAPLSPDADLGFLARQFKLSGGNIKNIVLEAAFLAADAGTPIGMPQLVRATRREHQKIGRLISAADFGPYAHLATGTDQAVSRPAALPGARQT